MSRVDLTVPDIGNFEDILVVDVLVKKGDTVEVDAPLVTLETDKASMDVPATAAGTVTEVLLKAGDKVSKGSVIARVETNARGRCRVGDDAAARRCGRCQRERLAVARQARRYEAARLRQRLKAGATFAESFDAEQSWSARLHSRMLQGAS